MDSNLQILQVLKGLLVVCRASESGFLSAADAVSSDTAREILYGYADQRRTFAEELRTVLRFHAGDWYDVAPPAPSIAGFPSSNGKGNTKEIVLECERAEEAMLRVYEDALSRKSPWDVYEVLSNHYKQIKEAHYFFQMFVQIHLPFAA